jgi:hypothetical protein
MEAGDAERLVLHNWMYAGFLAGLFLLAIAPVLAAPVGLPLLLVYLLLPVYVLHQCGEHYDDRFRKFVNDLLAGGWEVLSTRQWWSSTWSACGW